MTNPLTLFLHFAIDLQLLFYRKHHTMKWPWEEMAEEARQQSLFEDDDEPEFCVTFNKSVTTHYDWVLNPNRV